MALKDCVAGLDASAYSAYQTTINRAKAVCLAIRYDLFQAATRLAVNELTQIGKSNVLSSYH